MTSSPEVLGTGPAGAETVVARRSRRRWGVWWWLAVAVVAALGVGPLVPWPWSAHRTGLVLVTTDGVGYFTVDVDTGDTRAVTQTADLTAALGEVSWLPSSLEGSGRAPGGFPPWDGGREPVGSVPAGNLALVGAGRVRHLQLWSPDYAHLLRELGPATGVQGFGGDEVLVSNGCLVLGCATAVVDVRTGARTQLEPPAGYVVVDSAMAGDGTIALGLAAEKGTPGDGGRFEVLVGRPGSWLPVPDLPDQAFEDIVWSADGWLVVTLVDGEVVLWRPGVGSVETRIPPGTRVRAVMSSR